MKEAAAESCVEVHAGLQQHLGAADPYELTVEAPEPGADRIQPDPTGCWSELQWHVLSQLSADSYGTAGGRWKSAGTVLLVGEWHPGRHRRTFAE